MGKDRDDPTRRLMLPVKSNLAPDVLGLAYRTEPAGPLGAPVVAWEADPVDLDVEAVLSRDPKGTEAQTEREQAADWLREELADGPMPSAQVLKDGKANGFAEKTLRRAKRQVAEAVKDGFTGGWSWRLKDEDGQGGPKMPKMATQENVAIFVEGGHLRGDDWQERAAIAEIDGGLSREEAEAQADRQSEKELATRQESV